MHNSLPAELEARIKSKVERGSKTTPAKSSGEPSASWKPDTTIFIYTKKNEKPSTDNPLSKNQIQTDLHCFGKRQPVDKYGHEHHLD
jgi:hypothetical protein